MCSVNTVYVTINRHQDKFVMVRGGGLGKVYSGGLTMAEHTPGALGSRCA